MMVQDDFARSLRGSPNGVWILRSAGLDAPPEASQDQIDPIGHGNNGAEYVPGRLLLE